jgi:hypothetical protein
MHRPTFLLSALVATIAASTAGTAAAGQLTNDEPQPIPITAADRLAIDATPVAPTETTFRYRGSDIPTAEAARRDLACIERNGQTTCYDTEAEMEGLARAADHGGDPLSIWEHSSYHGWRVDTSTSCVWYDLPDGYSDQASSVKTGSHYGILAEHTGGRGAHLGLTSHTDEAHLSHHSYLKCGPPLGCEYAEWNDEASSRQRRGC